MSSNENYIFIKDIELIGEMYFNLSQHLSYLYKDKPAPVLKKTINGSNFLFECGYLINENFISCPITIHNVIINSFEIISYTIYTKILAFDFDENKNKKEIEIEIRTNSSFSSLPKMINNINKYIQNGKDLDKLNTSIFQTSDLMHVFDCIELLKLINNLKFEFFDISVSRVGKDDSEWTEVGISNLPQSKYLTKLFKTILDKLHFKITFNVEELKLVHYCQPHDNERDKEIIKDYLKFHIKEYFNPELELFERMSIY